MKIKNIFAIIALCALSLTACDYNDQFEGLEEMTQITNTQSIDYTLTDADYALMASKSDDICGKGTAEAAEMKVAGEKKAFPNASSAGQILAKYLAYTGGSFFTLSNGSAINLTYNYLDAEDLYTHTISDFTMNQEAYQKLWGDDKKYINAVTPSTLSKLASTVPAEKLADGDYVAVSYAYANGEPDFSGANSDGEFKENSKYTNVLGSVKLNDEVTVKGFISAESAQGPILTDNTGSLLLYRGDYNLGDEVTVTGKIASYNKGFQIAAASSAIEKTGTTAVAYPEPKVLDGAAMDEIIKRTNDECAFYAKVDATIAVSGTYYNFTVSGANTAQGSFYGITEDISSKISDGQAVTIYGYVCSISGGRYVNIVATKVESRLETTDMFALYRYEDGNFAQVSNVTLLQPADYTAFGQPNSFEYGDLFMNRYFEAKYPNAVPGDTYDAVYRVKSGSNVAWTANQFVFDGAQWTANDFVKTKKEQFVRRNGSWIWDPSVVITLPIGKNQPLSTQYFQAVTDWVYENIDVPLGSSGKTSGQYFVTTYGNNEYYTGASAYQGNVDVRASAAKGQYLGDSYQGAELVAAGVAFPGDGYGNLSDKEIQNLLIKRFQFVMGKVLGVLHPDAAPVEGMDVTYTINTGFYNGTSTPDVTLVYSVVGPGEFEFVEMTGWDE